MYLVLIILALATLGLFSWAMWLLRRNKRTLAQLRAAREASISLPAPAPAKPAAQPQVPSTPPAPLPQRQRPAVRPDPDRDELDQALARESEYLTDPQALPRPPDTLPDSSADGARLGELYVRAAALRGERSRREGKVRRQVASFCLLDMFKPAALLTVVAAGRPQAQWSQIGAVQASRSLYTKLVGRAAEIDQMWQAAVAGEDSAADRLSRLLGSATAGLCEPLEEVARHRDSAATSVATQVTCLLTRIGDTPGRERQHVAFGVGGGSVLVTNRAARWRPVPVSGDERDRKFLPADHASMWFAAFTTLPGDLVTVCGPTTSRLLEQVGERLIAEWATPPSMLRYLVQLGLADGTHYEDRAAVSLWEGKHGAVR